MIDLFPYKVIIYDNEMCQQGKRRTWCQNRFGWNGIGSYRYKIGAAPEKYISWEFKYQEDAILFQLTWS